VLHPRESGSLLIRRGSVCPSSGELGILREVHASGQDYAFPALAVSGEDRRGSSQGCFPCSYASGFASTPPGAAGSSQSASVHLPSEVLAADRSCSTSEFRRQASLAGIYPPYPSQNSRLGACLTSQEHPQGVGRGEGGQLWRMTRNPSISITWTRSGRADLRIDTRWPSPSGLSPLIAEQPNADFLRVSKLRAFVMHKWLSGMRVAFIRLTQEPSSR
jgi:hypothetical protein